VQVPSQADSEPSVRLRRIVRFGDFEFDSSAEALWRKGSRVSIQQQPFRLLATLLESPGDVVSRQALCRRLWPGADRAELDRNLNTALKKLRSVLQDSAKHPRYVETVRGRGYRFLSDIRELEPHARAQGARSVSEASWRKPCRVLLAALAAGIVALMVLGLGFCQRGAAGPGRREVDRLSETCLVVGGKEGYRPGPLPLVAAGPKEVVPCVDHALPFFSLWS
jgi:DNA-binding winged helix-turn-helix (wHTH) protein